MTPTSAVLRLALEVDALETKVANLGLLGPLEYDVLQGVSGSKYDFEVEEYARKNGYRREFWVAYKNLVQMGYIEQGEDRITKGGPSGEQEYNEVELTTKGQHALRARPEQSPKPDPVKGAPWTPRVLRGPED